MKAVISDFGGVLTTPLREAFDAYRTESTISVERLGLAMARAAQAHGDHPLFQLERGEISEGEFLHRLEEALGDGLRLDRFREVYFENLQPNRPMIDFMGTLPGRGLRMALLTNNVREWEALWRAKLPELDRIFEVVVDSAFVGMRKPERGIYELTLERLGGIAAANCLFVDDLDVNCQAARELGMHTVLYTNSDQAIPDIEAALAA